METPELNPAGGAAGGAAGALMIMIRFTSAAQITMETSCVDLMEVWGQGVWSGLSHIHRQVTEVAAAGLLLKDYMWGAGAQLCF